VTGVRTAAPDECEAIAAAYDWLFAPPGAPVAGWDRAVATDRLRAALADERSTVLVSEGLTGFCTVYLDVVSVRFGQRAWVEDLAVDPEHRSAGLGKELLDGAKDWARGRGATHLELDSGEAREAAHRFYEREQPSWRSICFGWEL
jgi:GNAT superfamily N-acetyltransferase